MVVLAPIVVFIFWLGVRPGLILDRMEASIEKVMAPLTSRIDPSFEQNHHHARLEGDAASPVLVIRDTENQ